MEETGAGRGGATSAPGGGAPSTSSQRETQGNMASGPKLSSIASVSSAFFWSLSFLILTVPFLSVTFYFSLKLKASLGIFFFCPFAFNSPWIALPNRMSSGKEGWSSLISSRNFISWSCPALAPTSSIKVCRTSENECRSFDPACSHLFNLQWTLLSYICAHTISRKSLPFTFFSFFFLILILLVSVQAPPVRACAYLPGQGHLI